MRDKLASAGSNSVFIGPVHLCEINSATIRNMLAAETHTKWMTNWKTTTKYRQSNSY